MEPEDNGNQADSVINAPVQSQDTIIDITSSADTSLITETTTDTLSAVTPVTESAPVVTQIESPPHKIFLFNINSPWLKRIKLFAANHLLLLMH